MNRVYKLLKDANHIIDIVESPINIPWGKQVVQTEYTMLRIISEYEKLRDDGKSKDEAVTEIKNKAWYEESLRRSESEPHNNDMNFVWTDDLKFK